MINFGIPKKTNRTKVEERFPGQAVLTICPAPTEKGHTWRFKLSKQAVQDMGFIDLDTRKITLVVHDENLYLMNDQDNQSPESYRVTNKGEFTNKNLHQYLTKHFDLHAESENHIQLISATIEGIELFKLEPILAGERAVEVSNNAVSIVFTPVEETTDEPDEEHEALDDDDSDDSDDIEYQETAPVNDEDLAW